MSVTLLCPISRATISVQYLSTLQSSLVSRYVIEPSFKVEKAGETLTTDLTLKFGDKDVDFQLVYDYYSMDVTGVTVTPIYSLGEKMSKAGLNTVISMSIVFVVLILISLIISCLSIIY